MISILPPGAHTAADAQLYSADWGMQPGGQMPGFAGMGTAGHELGIGYGMMDYQVCSIFDKAISL